MPLELKNSNCLPAVVLGQDDDENFMCKPCDLVLPSADLLALGSAARRSHSRVLLLAWPKNEELSKDSAIGSFLVDRLGVKIVPSLHLMLKMCENNDTPELRATGAPSPALAFFLRHFVQHFSHEYKKRSTKEKLFPARLETSHSLSPSSPPRPSSASAMDESVIIVDDSDDDDSAMDQKHVTPASSSSSSSSSSASSSSIADAGYRLYSQVRFRMQIKFVQGPANVHFCATNRMIVSAPRIRSLQQSRLPSRFVCYLKAAMRNIDIVLNSVCFVQ